VTACTRRSIHHIHATEWINDLLLVRTLQSVVHRTAIGKLNSQALRSVDASERSKSVGRSSKDRRRATRRAERTGQCQAGIQSITGKVVYSRASVNRALDRSLVKAGTATNALFVRKWRFAPQSRSGKRASPTWFTSHLPGSEDLRCGYNRHLARPVHPDEHRIQRQLTRGSPKCRYIRNVSLHFQEVWTEHVGDARYLNVTAAQNAISRTNSAFVAVRL